MTWTVGMRAIAGDRIISIMVTNPQFEHYYLLETVNAKHTLFRCSPLQGTLARTKIKEYPAIPENAEIIGDITFLS